MRLPSLARLLVVAAAAGAAGCGGATAPDGPGPAAFLNLAAGNGQTATVASLLPNPLVVTVTDAKARAVPGVKVSWAVTSGDGAVNPPSTTTDANGSALTTFSVGPTAGTNEVTASVTGVTTAIKFTVVGTAGPVSQVVASVHSLLFCGGADSGQVAASTTDQFGNPVPGTVTWVSRNPAVATVDAGGNVKLGNTAGSTWVVASASGAKSDSVLVGGAQPVTMAAGEVNTNLAASSVCVKSNQAGSEYMLAAFYNSTAQGNSASIVVTGNGVGAVGSGANIAASRFAAPLGNLQPAMPLHPDYAFEYALRERERREMPKYVPGARAWYAAMRRERAGANLSPTAAMPSGAAPAAAVAGAAPLAQQISSSAKVGDLVQLNTNANAYCDSPKLTTGRIAAISNSAIVVADTTNPAGGFTDAEYLSFAVAMDTLVMPVDTTAFGAPSDIDHNGRVVILFTKAVNALTTDPSQGVVLGFYYSRDLLPATGPLGSCPGSNQSEMFYLLVPDLLGTVNGGNNFSKSKQNVANIVVSTIGHEFQHLINASRRMYVINSPVTDEETWLNEGLSHVAEELIFYRAAGLTPRQDIGLTELSSPATYNAFGLYMWGDQGRYQLYLPGTETHGPLGESAGDDDLPTRGAVWSFLRYTADRLGPTDGTFWYRLVNSQTAGMPNLQQAIGADPAPFFRDWATSVFTDDVVPGIDARYTQPSWNWPQVYGVTKGANVGPMSHTLTSSVSNSVTVKAEGVSFFRFAVSNGQQGLISVTGAGGAALPSGIQLTLVRTK